MSTTYLQTNRSAAALYMGRELSQNRSSVQHKTTQSSPAHTGIDEGLLMVGIFCFLVPTMFTAAAFGLRYMEMSDVLHYSIYIIAAALVVRIATAVIVKGMAAEKNRSESVWMTIAMIAPAVCLVLMSFVSTRKSIVTAASNTIKMKTQAPARELYMPRRSQAI
ncbi:MAG: hypothetical protein ACK53B_06645 [Bacteroidota bacterium]